MLVSRNLLALQAFLMILLADPIMGKTLYVDANARGADRGTSWIDAYRYLQDALADANSADKPVEVRVAQGVYRADQGMRHTPGDREATFRLINGIILKGGFAGQGQPDPDHRDGAMHETILSGDLKGDDRPFSPWGVSGDLLAVLEWEDHARDNSYHVVTAHSIDGPAVLDGFTICRGNDDRRTGAGRDVVKWLGHGGGMLVSGGVNVRNSIFAHNFAGTGGALYGEAANLVVENCVFWRNCSRRGGGAYVKGSEAAFITSVFSANYLNTLISSTPNNAPGLACDTSQVSMTRCRFMGNWSVGLGGGIANLNQSHMVVSDSLFAGNKANYGAGIYNQDSTLSVTNCTFHGNTQYGIVCRSEHSRSMVDVANCIFALWDLIENRVGSVIQIKYSGMEGGKAQVRDLDPNGGVTWGQGNIEADPCFAAPGYWDDPCNTPTTYWDDRWIDGDYHLKSQAGRWDPKSQSWVKDDVTSPCIDTGDPASPIGCEPFPNGGRINMGAYGGTVEASKSYFSEPICKTIITGDINGDCRVDFMDLMLMASHWLKDAHAAPAPPPPTLPKR